MLDLHEHVRQVTVDPLGAHQSQPGVQLVDVAIGGHTRVGLPDPRAVEQRGVTCVAGPGVDFHGTQL
jgi:hypothetical protein